MEQIVIQMKMSPRWEATGFVHEGIKNLVEGSLESTAKAEQVSMVCTELVENAIKYGVSGADAPPISVELKGDRVQILVEVRNRLAPNQLDSLRILDETIQWIRGFQNPFEAYVESLRNVSRSSEDFSRMGMVRMAYEGGALLDFFVDEKDEVSISATITF